MKKILFPFLILLSVDFTASCQQFQSGSRWISAKSGLRMRDQPNLSGEKLDVIPYGERVNWMAEEDETVSLAGTTGKWVKVKWKNNLGWVYGGFLSNMHPDKAAFENEILSAYYSDKWGTNLALCRVELTGHGFTLGKDGGIALEEFGEYDLTKAYQYEKGISVSINEGYEWWSSAYEFDVKIYTVEEVFALACKMYGEQYANYLTTENDQLVLPTSNETWIRDKLNGYGTNSFQAEIIDGAFESFRIEEEEGCGQWWYFLIEDGMIRFGDGGGC